MEWVETTGRTIEEAKEAALDELGVDEQDAEFQILEEPKLGLFGRIRSEGRVRARVRPTTPRAKEDRRDRRRRTRAASAADGAAEGATETRPPTTNGGRTGGGGGAGGGSGGPAAAAAAADTATARGDEAAGAPLGTPVGGGEPVAAGSAAASNPTSSRPRRRRGAGGDADAAGTGAETAAGPSVGAGPAVGSTAAGVGRSTAAADSARRAGPTRPGGKRRPQASDEGGEAEDDRLSEGETLMDVALQDQAEVARDFLSGLLARFGVDAQLGVTTSEEDERVELRVDGDNLGLLIGPKGATLLAIQDLTRTYVQHRTSARNGRIHVDVAGYREKRAVALAAFVRKVAEDVTNSGKAVALEPMSAPDRKIVHDTAAQIGGLVTRSEGEDERRHVVLLPAPDGAGSPTDA